MGQSVRFSAHTVNRHEDETMDQSDALMQERKRFAAAAGGGVSLPVAGTLYWLALTGLGFYLEPTVWGIAAAVGSGLIFPLGVMLQGVFRSPFMRVKSPLTQPVIFSVIAINLLWPVHIAIILNAPEIAPLSLAIGMALHWPVIGWVYGSQFGIIHAAVRVAIVSAIWFVLPEFRFTLLPLSVVIVYAVTAIWLLITIPRAPKTGAA